MAVDLLFATKVFDRGVGWAKELPSKQQNRFSFAGGEGKPTREVRPSAKVQFFVSERKLISLLAPSSIMVRCRMARKTETDSKGPGEFLCFALDLPDELWPVSIVIGVVFGLIWLLGAVFRSFFGE